MNGFIEVSSFGGPHSGLNSGLVLVTRCRVLYGLATPLGDRHQLVRPLPASAYFWQQCGFFSQSLYTGMGATTEFDAGRGRCLLITSSAYPIMSLSRMGEAAFSLLLPYQELSYIITALSGVPRISHGSEKSIHAQKATILNTIVKYRFCSNQNYWGQDTFCSC